MFGSTLQRRGFLGLAGLATAATVGACSPSASPTTSASAPAGTTSAAAPASSAAGLPTTAIKLLSSGDADVTVGQGKALTDVLAAYTEKYKVPATLDRVPFDQYLASATTKARAGQLSDVVELLPGGNFEALFSSLIDFKESDIEGGDQLTGWPAAVKDPATPDAYFGAPIGAQGVVWYYNKELFTEAGLDPETPPATWAELKAAAKALKDSGVSGIGMSGSDSFILWWAWSALSPQFFTAEDVNKVRTGEIKLTDERFLRSLEPLKELYDEGLVAEDYIGKKFTDVEADFAANKVGIVSGIISNAINWAVWDEKLGKDAYGVMACPKVEGAPHMGQFFNPVLVYGVNAKSENPEAAKKLVEFLCSVEGQTAFLKEASQFPNRTDIDVVGVTGSKGAGQVLDIVKAVGGVDVAQNQFNGAAQSASWTNLTGTMQSGKLTEFLEDLERQQRS